MAEAALLALDYVTQRLLDQLSSLPSRATLPPTIGLVIPKWIFETDMIGSEFGEPEALHSSL
jgi:hypothetical protein